jgi:hypothetical protein
MLSNILNRLHYALVNIFGRQENEVGVLCGHLITTETLGSAERADEEAIGDVSGMFVANGMSLRSLDGDPKLGCMRAIDGIGVSGMGLLKGCWKLGGLWTNEHLNGQICAL